MVLNTLFLRVNLTATEGRFFAEYSVRECKQRRRERGEQLKAVCLIRITATLHTFCYTSLQSLHQPLRREKSYFHVHDGTFARAPLLPMLLASFPIIIIIYS